MTSERTRRETLQAIGATGAAALVGRAATGTTAATDGTPSSPPVKLVPVDVDVDGTLYHADPWTLGGIVVVEDGTVLRVDADGVETITTEGVGGDGHDLYATGIPPYRHGDVWVGGASGAFGIYDETAGTLRDRSNPAGVDAAIEGVAVLPAGPEDGAVVAGTSDGDLVYSLAGGAPGTFRRTSVLDDAQFSAVAAGCHYTGHAAGTDGTVVEFHLDYDAGDLAVHDVSPENPERTYTQVHSVGRTVGESDCYACDRVHGFTVAGEDGAVATTGGDTWRSATVGDATLHELLAFSDGDDAIGMVVGEEGTVGAFRLGEYDVSDGRVDRIRRTTLPTDRTVRGVTYARLGGRHRTVVVGEDGLFHAVVSGEAVDDRPDWAA